MSRPFEVVYSLLPEYEPAEVEGALCVVPALLGTVAAQELAAACRDYIEGKIVAPREPEPDRWPDLHKNKGALTVTEQDEILALIRHLNDARIRRYRQEDLREYNRLQFCQGQYRQRDMLNLVRVILT